MDETVIRSISEKLEYYNELEKRKETILKTIVSKYIDPNKGVLTYEDALNGALDIIAEMISNDEFIRSLVRNNVQKRGRISSKAKKDWIGKQSKFQDYYEFSELIQRSPSHRMLAIRRGSSEDVLTWNIEVAVKNSFKRLIFPSIEKEVFNLKMEGAEKEAIKVFSKNLRNRDVRLP